MINPVLVAFVVIALIAGVIIRPSQPPASQEFAAYRARLRRNLAISLTLPVAFTIYGLIASGMSASRGERFTHYPRGLYTVMGFATGYGFILLPLIALVVTELSTRAPSTRVATLQARSTRTLIPRWLLVLSIAAPTLSILTIAIALGTKAGLADAASVVDYTAPTGSLVNSLVITIAAAALAAWVIRRALIRPDIDPTSASDSWSRSGVAIRAAALATLAAIGAFATALNAFRSAWWAFHAWSELPASPNTTHSLTEGLPMSGLTDIVGLTALAVGVLVAVTFVKPPVLVPAEKVQVPA